MTTSTQTAAAGLVAVLFDAGSHPGIRAIGAHRPGVAARVAPEEAVRLVNVKRFRYATAEDAATAAAWQEQSNAAALAANVEPALDASGQGDGATTADGQE